MLAGAALKPHARATLQIPNAAFWGALGGLVRDGVYYSVGKEVDKADIKQAGINSAEELSASILSQDQAQASAGARRSSQGRAPRKKKPSKEGAWPGEPAGSAMRLDFSAAYCPNTLIFQSCF